jgi:hypothetical protein
LLIEEPFLSNHAKFDRSVCLQHQLLRNVLLTTIGPLSDTHLTYIVYAVSLCVLAVLSFDAMVAARDARKEAMARLRALLSDSGGVASPAAAGVVLATDVASCCLGSRGIPQPGKSGGLKYFIFKDRNERQFINRYGCFK